MKLEMPKRKPKAEGASRSSKVQAPEFAQDLYKDMRDRRLIIPAVALLIAIVAVPIVLSSPAEPTVTPPPIAEDPSAVAVEPAVFATQEVGVRDYRERLAELSKKDPFGNQFKPKEPKSADDAEDVTGAGGTGSEDSAVTASDSGSGSSTPPTTAPTDPPEAFVLVPRIDAVTKIVGRDREEVHENVEIGDVLPSKRAPVVMYLENSDDSQRAAFVVSRDVSRVNGDGTCKPGRNNCEFLILEDGQTAYLRYADGHRYALRVTDIYFVKIPESEFDQSGD